MLPLTITLASLAMVTSGGAQARDLLSDTTWKCSLNVGREKGTWMPKDWAASGARLVLPVCIAFSSEPFMGDREPLLGSADEMRRLRVLQPAPKFVGAQGEESVLATDGAWVATPTGRNGEHLLRFWLDFPSGAARNDVTLPAGRVFFTNGCWEAQQLDVAEKTLLELREEIETLDQVSMAEPSGGNIMQRASALRAAVLRSDQRRLLVENWKAVSSSLPGPTGSVDGPAARSVKVGAKGGLCVKRKSAPFGTEYHILGSHTMALLGNGEA
jgi:hypothetical protein